MKVGNKNFIVLASSLALSVLLCNNQLTWAQSSEPISKNQSGPTGVVGDTINNAINGTLGFFSGGLSSNQTGPGSSQNNSSSSNDMLGGLNMFGDSNSQTKGKFKSVGAVKSQSIFPTFSFANA